MEALKAHYKNLGDGAMHRLNQSWRKKFAVIWLGQSVSLLTSSILQMAIVWYLTEKTGSAAVLSFATLIGYLPAALLGMFIGTFIDRHSRKRIMVVADLSIALLGVLLVASGQQGEIAVWLIMLVLLLRSIGAAFHYPALQALTPAIVPKEHLLKYAGYAQSFESLSMVLSPALAALLFSIWDLTTIIFLDVAGALAAVITLCLVKLPKAEKPPMQERSHFLQETGDGFRELKRVQGMLPLMVIGALYAVIYFPIGTLYPFITMEYFGGGVAESGTVEVVFAVGSLLGSLILGLMGGKIKKIPMIATSIALYGSGVLFTGLLPPSGLKQFMVLSLVMGISVPFYTGIQTAIFQLKFREEYLGRIFALTSSVGTIAMPLGLILSGAFTDRIGINRLFSIAGVLTIVLSIVTALWPSLKRCCNTE